MPGGTPVQPAGMRSASLQSRPPSGGYAPAPTSAPPRQQPDYFSARPSDTQPAESQPPKRAGPPLPPRADLKRTSTVDAPALPPRSPVPSSILTPTRSNPPELPSRPSTGLSAPFLTQAKRPSSSGNPYRSPTNDSFDITLDAATRPRRSFESARDPAPTSPLPTSPPSRAPPQLPPCPRPTYAAGHRDWSTLPSAPDLDICPTCATGLYNAGFAGPFVPSRPKSAGCKTRCDLGNPWIRMAWLLHLSGQHPRTVDPVARAAHILAAAPPCPGPDAAPRAFARVFDAQAGACVPDFDVCPACAQLVLALFPALQGAALFRPSTPSPSSSTANAGAAITTTRPCALAPAAPHFAAYLDLLDEAARHAAAARRPPDVTRFVALARRVARAPACGRDDQFRGARWHVLAGVPALTVCEACYLEAVLPQVARGSGVARRVEGTPRVVKEVGVGGVSCQLYSGRMRGVWREACEREDVGGLKECVGRRLRKERELQRRLEESKALPEERRREQVRWLVEEWRKWE